MGRNGALPVWRSLLYVPVNVDRFVDRAHTRGADAIQLDLEDSIPLSEKDSARRLVQAAAQKVSRGGADVVVRINRPLRMAIRDLEESVSPHVHAIALPKVDSAGHIRLLSEVVSELEQERGMPVGSTRFIAMVETPDALLDVRDIARADERVVALTLGSEDFATAVGMVPDGDGLYFPKMQVLIAARAAGILPLGFVGTVADYKDQDAFRDIVRRARRLGFRGASCIHPLQVQVLNEEFTPPAEEVEKARRVIEAYEAAKKEGRGSIEVDGRMVDEPIVRRAEELVAIYEAIAARSAAAQG